MVVHLEELISAYLDGELNETEKKQVENHLANCEECKEIYLELQELKNQVYSMYRTIELPDRMEEKIMNRIELNEFNYQTIHRKIWIQLVIPVFLLFVLIAYQPLLMSIGILSSFAKILYKLTHLLSMIAYDIPYLLGSLILFSLITIFLSIWSLRKLFINKAMVRSS